MSTESRIKSFRCRLPSGPDDPFIGPPGKQGKQGPPGPGVPANGNPGQVLVKKTYTDYDTEWANTDLTGAVLLDQTITQYITDGFPINLSEPTFTYLGGNLVRVDYPSGYYKEFQYNPDGSLDRINLNGEYLKIFSYDLDGNLLSIMVI